VLLVDCGPQGSLTAACGVTDAAENSPAEVLGGAAQAEARAHTWGRGKAARVGRNTFLPERKPWITVRLT